MLAALGRILKAEGIETDSIKLLMVGEIGMANAPGVSISFSNDLYSVNGAKREANTSCLARLVYGFSHSRSLAWQRASNLS